MHQCPNFNRALREDPKKKILKHFFHSHFIFMFCELTTVLTQSGCSRCGTAFLYQRTRARLTHTQKHRGHPLFSREHLQLHVTFICFTLTGWGRRLHAAASGAALFVLIRAEQVSQQILFWDAEENAKPWPSSFHAVTTSHRTSPSIHCTADKLAQWQSFPYNKSECQLCSMNYIEQMLQKMSMAI